MEQTAQPTGIFEARYVAFLETIVTLRPKLHRYCARMTGSVLDGEDVMQDALFQAYRKLEQFDENRPLAPWLFRIAHNQCIDFLRRRDVREGAESEALVEDAVEPVEAVGHGLDKAIEHLVLSLPPKERACVLLKDVLDYSLEEIAELVDSTVGGVKAALNRGRTKLAASKRVEPVERPAENPPRISPLLSLYLERFNRRDWDGLLELISADARLRVADRYFGDVASAPYYSNYAKRQTPWRASIGAVHGEAVIVVFQPRDGVWNPASLVRIEERANRVARIVDYNHWPWVLASAELVVEAPVQRILARSSFVPRTTAPQPEDTMKTTRQVMVRYKTKPDRAAENENFIKHVFAALDRTKPPGIQYSSYRLADGVSFVHVASYEMEEGNNPLTSIPEFKAFTAGVKDRCEEPPVTVEMTVVGRYSA